MSGKSSDTHIFVLYNAKASLLGKLSYGYKKLCAPADDSPCAACDLTHGGLKLHESEEWTATKQKIPATVEQRHIDELTPELRDFVKKGAGEGLASGPNSKSVGMFDIALRQWKDAAADPVARSIPKWITPGQVTAAAFIAGLLACLTATNPDWRVLALCAWGTNRFLDCVDGSLARHRHMVSDMGGFQDLLCDFIVYSILPIAVAFGQDTDSHHVDWVSIAFLEATFHVNNFVLFYSAAVAAQKDDKELTSVTMRPALIEGFESGLFFTSMLVWPHHVNMWARIMSSGVAIGIVQRSLAVVRVLGSKKSSQSSRRPAEKR